MKKKLLIATTKALSFCFNRNITSKPNHLSIEVCYCVDPLKVQQRGWSHAASVPSEAPETQKHQKRVPRHERRAMVEAFVNKYRAENAGKFPRISDTRKQVGGCYYIVREIIQELQYKSKMNSSNSVDEILVGKQFDESLDDKETVNTGYEHLEENREPQTSYLERRLLEEVEIMSTQGKHCDAPESNIVEKFSKEPYPISVDINIEEAVSTYSDSFAPESQLLQEEREHPSSSLSENGGTGYEKTQVHAYDFVHMENHLKVEEKCIKKADDARKEPSDLEDLSRELSHSRLRVPNGVTITEAVSSSSDSVAQEKLPLKVEMNQFSAPCIEKSVSSCTEGQSHDSKLLDMEKHSALEEKNFEKEEYERQDQEVVNGLKHKIKQSQRSLELDESKTDSSNNRETSVAVGTDKPSMWGNLKSFANGIINIWKKL